MPRRLRVLFYAVCGTVVAAMGWAVLLFGGALYLLFGAEQFPRVVFWVGTALSLPVFFVVLFKYFDRREPQ